MIKVLTQWAFTKEVRTSLGASLNKVSWLGLAAFSSAGIVLESWLVAICTALWFLLFQTLAHVVLGLPCKADNPAPASQQLPDPHSRLAAPMERDRAPPAA